MVERDRRLCGSASRLGANSSTDQHSAIIFKDSKFSPVMLAILGTPMLYQWPDLAFQGGN
jgi:hypothetical protein